MGDSFGREERSGAKVSTMAFSTLVGGRCAEVTRWLGAWVGCWYQWYLLDWPDVDRFDIAWSIMVLFLSVQEAILAFPIRDSYSSTASISDRFVRAYLNSGRSSRRFIGTGSKLRSSRRACISFFRMHFALRSSRTVYVMSIYFTLIFGRIGCFGGCLIYLVCRAMQDSVYIVVVAEGCVDVLGSAPEDYAN